MDKDAELIRYIATLLATAQAPSPPRSSPDAAMEATLRMATTPPFALPPPPKMPLNLGYQAPAPMGLRRGLVAPVTFGLPLSGLGIGMPPVGQESRRSVLGRPFRHSRSFDAFFRRDPRF